MVRTPATLEAEHRKLDICANPHCEREVGMAGVFVADVGRICGSCFRNVRRGIVFDENNEMRTMWRKQP
jgi:hypothetical protein